MTQQAQTEPESQSPHHLEQQRRENREAIAALGARPYGVRADGLVSLAQARAMYDEAADQKHQDAAKQAKESGGDVMEILGGTDPRPIARVAGRIVLKRDGGRLIWM